VAAEVADPEYCVRLFADPNSEKRKLVSPVFAHRNVGGLQMCGLYCDLEDTPARIYSGPIWPGERTRQILDEYGYSADETENLLDSGVADDTSI
jgi:crotonobetainyl-CoA:carnitine CoA-transferase CaiB-like acyl-CoA transferase